MGLLRCIYRLPTMAGLLFLGLGILVFLFPRWNDERRINMIRRWSQWCLSTIGLRLVRRSPQTLPNLSHSSSSVAQKGYLLAANHVSWLDIFVINAIEPQRFVAKSDIRSWPLAGKLCELSGTLFIERTRRTAVREILEQMKVAMSTRQAVAVFPEGTTNDMLGLLPLHSNLFQAVVGTENPVIPVALRYQFPGGQLCEPVRFIGAMTFVGSVLQVCKVATIEAHYWVDIPIEPQTSTRHEISAEVEAAIKNGLAVLAERSN
jgi:1-acyl-sn-glycerol-3-phosphate acyltransferase